MNLLKYLGYALQALLSQTVSIRVGNYTLTASNNGTPVTFTFATALAAVETFFAHGELGTSFQVGSILVSVVKNT